MMSPDIGSVLFQAILSILVFAGTIQLCQLVRQMLKPDPAAAQLAEALRHYQQLFPGEFPKRIRIHAAPDLPAVFEIRRLADPKAGAP